MNTGIFSPGILTALTAGLLMATAGSVTAAPPDDGKSYPGSMCQVAGSNQHLYYGSYSSGATLANRTSSQRTVICPFVRDHVYEPWKNVTVRVRDRHDRLNVSCEVWAYDVDGQSVWVSPTLTSVGTGSQTLTFGAGLAESGWGTFVLSCTLPPMQGNVPTYVASYQIRE